MSIRWIVTPALLVAIVGPASAQPGKIAALLTKAESHEKAREWDKAFNAYDDALKVNRDAPVVKDRQTTCLRRYWQDQRHKDIGYRKEVLSLEYSQAIRLNGAVIDALIENSLPKTKIAPGDVLKKGIEELEAGLRDPQFKSNYLPNARPAAIASFRELLARKKTEAASLDRRHCMKALREIALAGQTTLELSPTVSLMELACGACYAIDEYTAYLTPTQFRELTDSFKTPMMGFVPSVRFEAKTADIGYVHVSHFQESTPQEVDAAFLALYKAGMKGLILDLRGNPGGLVESAVDVARRFLVTGVIASTESYDPKQSATYHASNSDAWTLPVVVLVDSDTASAAEVLAGALKDNGRARLLGQPTFGKGSSQGLIKLPDAVGNLPTGGLRLTIARFFSPKGSPYAGQGVTPDVILEVFKPEDGMDMMVVDPAIIAAEAELRRQFDVMR